MTCWFRVLLAVGLLSTLGVQSAAADRCPTQEFLIVETSIAFGTFTPPPGFGSPQTLVISSTPISTKAHNDASGIAELAGLDGVLEQIVADTTLFPGPPFSAALSAVYGTLNNRQFLCESLIDSGNAGDQLVAKLEELVGDLQAAHPAVSFIVPPIAGVHVGDRGYSVRGGGVVLGQVNVEYFTASLTLGCAGPGCIDPFLCYKARATAGSICAAEAAANAGAACQEEEDCGGVTDDTAYCVPNKVVKGLQVGLADQFEAKDYDVKKPVSLCAPAAVDAAGALDAATHLKGYQVKEVRKSCAADAPLQAGGACAGETQCGGTPRVTAYCRPTPKHAAQRSVLVENGLGGVRVDTVKAERLLVPTAKGHDGPVAAPEAAGHGVDHFKCYKVKVTKGAPRFAAITGVVVEDQFTGTSGKVFDLEKPTRLCTPVDKNGEDVKNPTAHLLCYLAKSARGEPKHAPEKGLHVNNQLGPEQLDTVKEEELCVPSTVTLPADG